jgi:tetratricopeptide (TPR) repeat protein
VSMKRVSILTLLVGLLVATAAFARTQAFIKGNVVDADGKPVANAVITITSSDMPDFNKVVNVKEDGSYAVLILDATRHYLFHVEAPGRIAVEQHIKVEAGSTDNVFDFKLKTQAQVMEAEKTKLLSQPGYKEMEEGRALLDKGDRAAARAKFREAVAAKDNLVSAWVALSELAFDAKDFKEALTDAEKCLSLDDEQIRCLAVAANASKEIGDKAKNAEYMKRYQSLNPDDPATVFNEAATYLNKMDDEHAKPLLEKCLKADPDFPSCLYEYGMLLLRSGDMAGAKEKLQHYLKVAPDGPNAKTVQDTLKYL